MKSKEHHLTSEWYHDFNDQRLKHLDQLGLNLHGKKVLELGAALGDLTTFWLDKDCEITVTEPREENRAVLKSKFPALKILHLNLNETENDPLQDTYFDIAFCYGLLYLLKSPLKAIQYLSQKCDVLLIETIVNASTEMEITKNKNSQIRSELSNQLGMNGYYAIPSRKWVFTTLKFFFPNVYVPLTQPKHNHFPINWADATTHKSQNKRAIFVASKHEIKSEQLSKELIDIHNNS